MNRALFGIFFAFTLAMMSPAAAGPAVSGTFASIPAGTVVNLSAEGELDWVHWGLFTESSVNRKASVLAQISNYTLVDASNGFAYAYQFGDNANGYYGSTVRHKRASQTRPRVCGPTARRRSAAGSGSPRQLIRRAAR